MIGVEQRWPGAHEYLLALADDEHLMGQQHTEWVGTAPFLEEDLAFCSIAQDELGHAAALYELLGDADQLAFGRDPSGYRSCPLVELPCAGWAEALARHWLYDLAERERWAALDPSAHAGLAGVVARALREEQYHLLHASTLIDTLLGAGGEAAERLGSAITSLLADGDGLWEAVRSEPVLVDAGLVTRDAIELRSRWRAEVQRVVGHVAWEAMTPTPGSRLTRTEHFGALYDRITEVFRIDPSATW